MSQEKKDPILVPDLYVVSMPNPHNKNAPVKPWPGMEELFIAEACGRYTFVLTSDDFKSLPPTIAEAAEKERQERLEGKFHDMPVRVEQGPRAYHRLLRLAVGLEDANEYNSAVVKYVKPEWEAYQRTHPERAESFRKIMDWVNRDTKRVNSETEIAQLPKPTRDLAARRLMRIHKDSSAPNGPNDPNADQVSVLLVADAAPITFEMSKVLMQAAGINKLYVTHPDPAKLEQRWGELQQNIKYKELNSKHTVLEKMPFEAAMQHMDRFKHVVVCTPMGVRIDKDQAVIDAWKSRQREDGLLIHRKGNPRQKQETTPPWSEAGIPNFRDVEDLTRERDAITEGNRQEIRKGIGACRRLAIDKLARSAIEDNHPKQWRARVRVHDSKPYKYGSTQPL